MRSLILIVLCITASAAFSQNLLDQNMSLEVNRQRLDHVLEIISNKGNFFFSYNSSIIKKDSLVSGKFSNQKVKDILTEILGTHFDYRESGNYIILRRAPIRLRLVTSSAVSEDKYYTISGYVIDDQTGEKVSDASVYEKDRLTIASTNTQGYFKIKLKSKYKTAAISVSKEYYEDTTVLIEPRLNQSVLITLVPMDITEHTVTIGPDGYQAPESIELAIPINDSMHWLYTYVKRDSVIVEKTSVGKWLVSSRAKLQSINLKKFFVARPYQVSVIPGMSTNGKLNSQVINNFSLNIFGGYAGGVNGLEIGGLFNIDKKDAQYVQVGGLFNLVGGHFNGFQVGGISNTVLDSLRGFQVGGVTSFVKNKFSGFQVSGVYNHVGATFDGAQVAGVVNYVNHHTNGAQIAGVVNFTNHYTTGAQIAGVANISSRAVRGAQIAGVFNYTRRLKGVQIGLINVADTSDGYSIGLINIVFKGYHKLSLYTNEVIDANAAFKTGNSKLYSILLAGYNTVPDEKVWTYGYGIGTDIALGKRFSFNPELTCQQLYLGSWDHYNLLNRANVHLNFKIGKLFSIFAGPVYSVYVSNQDFQLAGYKKIPPSSNTHKFGNTVTGWLGWTAGVNIF